MPPRALDRGGAAAPRDPAPAPAPTLRASFAALPSLVEQLLLAVRSCRQPAASAEEALGRLLQQLAELPHVSPRPSAEMAELLSSNPEAAAALLRLQALALRPGAEGGGGITRARGRGSGGGSGSGSGDAAWMQGWRRTALETTTLPLIICVPLPASRHALSVLRFARGMLRAQALHALSRNLEPAAAALDRGSASGSGNGSGSSGSSGGGGGGSEPAGGGGDSRGATASSVLNRMGGGGIGGGGGGGGGVDSAAASVSAVEAARCALPSCIMHLTSANRLLLDDTTYAGVLFEREGTWARALPLTGLAAEVAAARAAAVEEYARALAESGILEHAARLLLLLQARGPHAVRPAGQMRESLSLGIMKTIFQLAWHGFTCERDGICRAMKPDGVIDACPCAVSPAAAAPLRSALRGRCVQTAVLVYGVGVLRLADRGSSCGLPAALQTAGLSVSSPSAEGSLATLELLLRQLASPNALRPPGPAASAALALRVGRAAMGSVEWEVPRAFVESTSGPPPPPRSATPLPGTYGVATRLTVASLQTGRRLLPAGGPAAAGAGAAAADSVQWSAQRADWWRLAVQMLVYGMSRLLSSGGGLLLRQLYDMMAEALAGVWPERKLDLDALPAEAPPEVAAALAGGLLGGLTMSWSVVVGTPDRFTLPAVTELLAACDRAGAGARPGSGPSSGPSPSSGPGPGPGPGSGLALFLVPLLAYGERAEAEDMLWAFGGMGGLEPPVTGQQHPAAAEALDAAAVKQAATGFLGAADGALKGCRQLPASGRMLRSVGVLADGPSAAHLQAATSAATSAPGTSAAAAAMSATASAAPDAPPPGPLLRLSHCVAFASVQWGLPLPQVPEA